MVERNVMAYVPPERDLELDATSVLVEWGTVRLIGPGRLRLTSETIELEANGESWTTAYADLAGGSWRTGSLVVHSAEGRAVIESREGLDLAWVRIIERACPLPELARDHRLLGSRRGGPVSAQTHFLSTLLDARKRLEKEPDLETRIALLDAKQMRERVGSALQTIARETFPISHPDRRALEAEMEEAMSVFFRQLDAMDSAATHFRTAPETIRFSAWRDWVARVRDAYAAADGAWADAARFLP